MDTDDYQRARNIVLSMVSEKSPTVERLAQLVDIACAAVTAANSKAQLDRDSLRRDLEESLNVFQAESVSLENSDGHEPWLEERRNQVSWSFWNRYLRLLREKDGLPPAVLDRLDVSTDRVLGRLEDPQREGQWSRRGLVVGQVQSGKTSNYTGLICKAADAGYRFIIVLSGIHESLRSQTQLRLDQGLLGFDTQRRKFVGQSGEDDGFADVAICVGRLPGERALFSVSLTTSAEKGDFKKSTAQSVPLQFAGPLAGPVVLVVKKNVTILKNLHAWLESVVAVGSPKHVQEHAVLLIDDEADNASINTRKVLDDNNNVDPDYDPTKVNAGIRRLLKLFDRSAYVGYTATPFANLYVEDVEHPEYGPDLFPESFIEYLRAPSNYFGPTRLFGHGEVEGLPLHRDIDDYDNWMPDKHKVSHRPPRDQLPASLREAIAAFILVRAARLARGQERTHNSMLVHVSRFKDVQAIVSTQVTDELDTLRARIKYENTSGRSVMDELRGLWERDFEPTSQQLVTSDTLCWSDVQPHLVEAVRPIIVKTINGEAKDALEYYENRDNGLNVIAIGGDKLSRGLTLEGLSVSYYLRASRTFDTLMQMGRWFGYRPGYEDLCRLYTSENLWRCYREVTSASEELVAEFETMASQGLTPRDYGLKVKNSVDGMMVTAPNKMISATNLRIGFAGAISETVLMYCKDPEAGKNRDALTALLSGLGNPSQTRTGNLSWEGVPGRKIVDDFFNRYTAPSGAWRVHPQMIARYIDSCMRLGELVSWTVVLVDNSNTNSDEKRLVGGHMVGLTRRSVLKGQESKIASEGTYSIRRILSPADEWSDFSDSEVEDALASSIRAWNEGLADGKEPSTPYGRVVRENRPVERCLLVVYPLEPIPAAEIASASKHGITISDEPVIGFAVSFPASDKAVKVEYTANKVYLRELFSMSDSGEDE